jgi:hypothetical protein
MTPGSRRIVFFDVENSSRAEHVGRVLAELGLDSGIGSTRIIAMGNWRVVGHETVQLLARSGAQLIHSAPVPGVKDWTDLSIAVAAGVWLGEAAPGDVLEIVTDDQASDAVGDVAAGYVSSTCVYRTGVLSRWVAHPPHRGADGCASA